MINIKEVIAIIDAEIEAEGVDFLTPPQANKVLEEKGILNDSKHRPGLPLRNLLRDDLLPHAYQVEGKWRIPHSKKVSEIPTPIKSVATVKINQRKKFGVKECLIIGSAIFFIVFGLIFESEHNTPNQSEAKESTTPAIIYDTVTANGWVKNIYSINGKIASEGLVKNKFKDSTWSFYSDSTGRLSGKITFKSDIKEGDFVKYYSDGTTIDEKGTYENNKLTGIWEHYFDNGLISDRYHYLNGLWDGKYEGYDIQKDVSNEPFLKTIGYYRYNKKEGEWDEYNYYFDLKTKTVGKKIILTDVENYSDDKLNGINIQYDEQLGFKLLETSFVNGIENGIRKSYCPEGRDKGKLWIVEEYRNGNLVNKLPYQCDCDIVY